MSGYVGPLGLGVLSPNEARARAFKALPKFCLGDMVRPRRGFSPAHRVGRSFGRPYPNI